MKVLMINLRLKNILSLKGEGIQHIALGTEDVYQAVESLAANGVKFMKPP